MRFIFLTLSFFATSFSFGQELCDSVYAVEFVDKPAEFSDESKRVEFFIDELVPVLKMNEIPTSFYMIVVVDANDSVVGIKSIRNVAWQERETEILEVLQSANWNAALKNGEKVCSEAYFVYSCILLK